MVGRGLGSYRALPIAALAPRQRVPRDPAVDVAWFGESQGRASLLQALGRVGGPLVRPEAVARLHRRMVAAAEADGLATGRAGRAAPSPTGLWPFASVWMDAWRRGRAEWESHDRALERPIAEEALPRPAVGRAARDDLVTAGARA